MPAPLIAAAPIALSLGKDALKEFQKPIIGYKVTQYKKSKVVEKSFQLSGWQFIALAGLGALAATSYISTKAGKSMFDGWKWPSIPDLGGGLGDLFKLPSLPEFKLPELNLPKLPDPGKIDWSFWD